MTAIASSNRGVSTPLASAVALVVLGAVTTLGCLYTYFSALSRATALWTLPLALGYTALGVWSLRTHKPPNRLALLALVILSMTLVITGLTTFVYSLMHLPISV